MGRDHIQELGVSLEIIVIKMQRIRVDNIG